MNINEISRFSYNAKYQKYNAKKTNINKQSENKNVTNLQTYYMPVFTARVDKGMERFYEFNKHRMPKTLLTYMDTLSDKFSLSPIEAQQKAFEKLKDAVNIQKVKELFPSETLFENLKELKDTKASIGLLAVYREFKDIYDNGILNTGDDFTVYLLKKIFLEAKTLSEINEDLDNDLNEDLKQEYESRYKNSPYIHSSTLQSLGITLPDTHYLNSLKFTREGYSDVFGAKISEAQLKYWNSLSDDQKFDILSKRCEGRDNWWNSLSHNERLTLVAGIDEPDEVYKDYKKYVNSMKRQLRAQPDSALEIAPPKKRITMGSANLKDRDIFGLWMRKNLEKFYATLPEADKDIVYIKRSRKMALRWKNMTPEEKTEYINKIRTATEPAKFAMIDAWNHCPELVKELSLFLREKQILKPIDMVYSTEEFSEFQSKIMTEFWSEHEEMATIFGEAISKAYARVEESMHVGQFEVLKQEILRNRAYRRQLMEHELHQLKIKEQETDKLEFSNADYKQDFIDAYLSNSEDNKVFPKMYNEDVAKAMVEYVPENLIIQYTSTLIKGVAPTLEVMEMLNDIATGGKYKKIDKYQKALEQAIADEMAMRNSSAEPFYQMNFDILSVMLAYEVKKDSLNKVPKNKRINLDRIAKRYQEYKQDIPKDELNLYAKLFFLKKDDPTNEDRTDLLPCLELYGSTLNALFSYQSAYSNSVKKSMAKKIAESLPEDLKEKYVFLYEYDETIKLENVIKQIRNKMLQNFQFVNKEFMEEYIQESSKHFRYVFYSQTSDNIYRPETFLNNMGKVLKWPNEKRIVPRIFRELMSDDFKIKILAMEQAIADELERVSGEKTLSVYRFENLCDLYERAMLCKKVPSEVTVYENDAAYSINILSRPNKYNINNRYKEYLEDYKDLLAEREAEGEELTNDDIIYWLNPDSDAEYKDEGLRIKIKSYNLPIEES